MGSGRFEGDRKDAWVGMLHVHAQTVRYRMGQVREAYGDRLDDPATLLDLVVALGGSGSWQPGSGTKGT